MRYHLDIHAEGRSEIPEEVRLRHLLKRMLRDLGFLSGERITQTANDGKQTPPEQSEEANHEH